MVEYLKGKMKLKLIEKTEQEVGEESTSKANAFTVAGLSTRENKQHIRCHNYGRTGHVWQDCRLRNTNFNRGQHYNRGRGQRSYDNFQNTRENRQSERDSHRASCTNSRIHQNNDTRNGNASVP